MYPALCLRWEIKLQHLLSSRHFSLYSAASSQSSPFFPSKSDVREKRGDNKPHSHSSIDRNT